MIAPPVRFPPFRTTLDHGRAERFAAAVGDVLRPLPGGGVETPVGSLFYVAAQDPTPLYRRLGLGWEDILFGGVELAYARPLAVGETLDGATELAAYRERGDIGIADLRTDYSDAAGARVLRERSTLIVRRRPAPAPDPEPAPGPRATAGLTVTGEAIAVMAGAIADPNPIHRDDALARRAGFRSAIAHGTFPIGAIAAHIAAERGAGAIAALAVRLLAPTYPGDVIEVVAAPAATPTAITVTAGAGGRPVASGTVEVR